MKKQNISIFVFISFLAISCPIEYCHSGHNLGFTYTKGPSNYSSTDISLYFQLSKRLGFDLGYSFYNSTGTKATKTLYGDLNIDLGKNFYTGVSLSNTPEVDDYKTNTAGLNSGMGFSLDKEDSERSNYWVDLGVDFAKTTHSQHVDLSNLTRTRWIWYNLGQQKSGLNAALTFFKFTVISFNFSKYSYSRNLSVLEEGLYFASMLNATFSNSLYLVQGFPKDISTIGLSRNFWDYFKLSFSKTHMNYMLYGDYSDSYLGELSTYHFQPLKFKISYNIDSPNYGNKSEYYSFGINLYF